MLFEEAIKRSTFRAGRVITRAPVWGFPRYFDLMTSRRRRPMWVLLVPVVNVVVWVLFTPADDGRSAFVRQVVAEMLGTTAVVLFAIALLLSTRARFLEPWFGGLDKMYRVHKETSVVGFLLLPAHVVLVPWRLEPGGGVPAGLIAFAGFLILVVLTLGPRMRLTRRWVTLGYRSWKRTHRLIGVFFIFSCAHMFLVEPLVMSAPILLAIVMAAYVVGILSYLYNFSAARLVRPTAAYLVDQANRINDTTTEVVLRPKRKGIEQSAGQFVFVRFRRRGLRESHPFTVASNPQNETLKLVVKASGDFTALLHKRLVAGTKARVEGSYGMLDYRKGGNEQVWVAGGIGVAPFLSWLRDIDTFDRTVDFFYTVRHPEDVLFADEIEAIAARHPDLRFHLTISSQDGSLTVDRMEEASGGSLAGKSTYMCGPVPMIQAFEIGLIERGVNPNDIHYEEFAFR